MATINYEDKVAINVNPNIPEVNKVTDGNMNLIKQVGNQILTTMGVYTDDWNSSSTYAVGDIVIYDNRIFRNLTGTNTATTPDQDTTNWEETTIAAMAGGADIPIRPTAPVSPSTNDLWIDTSDDNRLKYFNGISWVGVSDNITGDTLPIGSIMPYGSTTAPTNWLVCDGSAVSRTTYAELFSAIGTSFGAGDGSTTFNLPNLKGRVAVGQDTNDTDFDTMGETGGEKKHTLTSQEIPTMSALAPTSTSGGSIAYFSNSAIGGFTGSGAGAAIATINGGGQAHNILQPYQVVCYIIKAKQSAGVVAEVENASSNSQVNVYSCDYINDKFGEAIWEDIDTSSWTKASGFTITFAKYNKLTHEVWIQAENNSSSGAMNGTVFTTVPAEYRPSSSTNIKNSATIWWSSSVTTSSIMAKADITAQSGGGLQLFFPIHTTGYNISINLRYIAD